VLLVGFRQGGREVAFPGRRVEFGISVVPNWTEGDKVQTLVTAAEEAGFDLVGIQDHPYQWRFFDTWSLIAFLAARTTRIRFFPDVACLPLRPPAMLAKAAASLDVLSGGRVELGLGAGSFWDHIEAMGGPRRTPAEAVKATEEAIDVIRLVWSGERARRYEGRFYGLGGVNAGPSPAHPMGIWLGAYGPRMLRLIGRKADGWIPSAFGRTLTTLQSSMYSINQAADEAGRSPSDIRRLLNVGGAIEEQHTKPFVGPVSYWVEELSSLMEIGVDTLVFWANRDEVAQIETFAAEIIPRLRQD
jgi:alkanesulfonate monooxygenase SsuD/methylene tetrahydromethanopterin reductase-like flavin-dependent oxidoreductase (luciferase family)